MKFKPIPPAPDDLGFVASVQSALPLVPGSESDCCSRIMSRTGVSPRDEARTWITFLRALELATESSSGFRRLRREPDDEHLRSAFRNRVYGAQTVVDIVEAAADPLSAQAVYEEFLPTIPPYEQHKHGHRLEEIWGERVRRLLEWAVVLGLLERVGAEPRYSSLE